MTDLSSFSNTTQEVIMERYKCPICGHIYDPAEGDSKSEIAPGNAFEDLPEDWKCPVCCTKKTKFQPVQPQAV